MSILGAVLRTHPSRLGAVVPRLQGLPGVDIALNPGDGRLVLVLEDALGPAGQPVSAAATLADMALWPEVLSTSLVYEYSGPDAPAAGEPDNADFRRWRSRPGAALGPADAANDPAGPSPDAPVPLPVSPFAHAVATDTHHGVTP